MTARARIILAIVAAAVFVPSAALAQTLTLDMGGDGGFTSRIVQLVLLMTVLSLAPSILIMMTSFIRIVVVLSLLRTAISAQQSPPNPVIMSLALFLTAFVMAPTFTEAYNAGVAPLMKEEMPIEQALDAAARAAKFRKKPAKKKAAKRR